jgi:hypothetical protein
MSHAKFANKVCSHPLDLLPQTLKSKESSLRIAAGLSASGWQIFMQAYMSPSHGITSAAKSQEPRAGMAQKTSAKRDVG